MAQAPDARLGHVTRGEARSRAEGVAQALGALDEALGRAVPLRPRRWTVH